VSVRARQWLVLALLLVVSVGLWLPVQQGAMDWLQRERLEAWLAQLGVWAPVGLVAVEVLQVLLAPVPGHVVGLAAGYLYGVWAGTALCMLGLMLGTGLAVWLARRLGRPLVERLVPAESLQRLERFVQRHGVRALLIIFLVPFLPDDAACLLAGLTTVPIRQVLVVALIGRMPGVLASALIGAQAQALSTGQIVALVAGSLGVLVLFWLFQERLERAAYALAERLAGKRRTGH